MRLSTRVVNSKPNRQGQVRINRLVIGNPSRLMDLDQILDLVGDRADWSDSFGLPFPALIRFQRLDTTLDLAHLQTLQTRLAADELPGWLQLQSKAVPKRRNEWLLGRINAKQALRNLHAGSDGTAPDWQAISLLPDEQGKPIPIVSGAVGTSQISISHTRDALAVIAADTRSSVGIDLEPLDRIQSDCRAFARHTLSEREQAMLADGPDCTHQLLCFWVAKEAAAKAVGTGFQGQPKQFELDALPVEGQARVVHRNRSIPIHLRELAGYLVAVAFCD